MERLIAVLEAALREALTAAGLSGDIRPLVVAVSGGPDSLVLLDAMTRLLPAHHLVVAHLDHALRPSSADEARAVAALAGARGLRSHVARIEVAALSTEQRRSLEEAGRIARYDFLAGVADREGAAAVVTGHTADDQVETILLHLLRGAGATGLRGMTPAAPLPGCPDLWLLRPMLGIDRAAVERYVREAGLQPLIDDSNRDPGFLRNRVRHELLPVMAQLNPQARARMLSLAATTAAEDDLLTALEEVAWRDVAEAGLNRVRLSRDGWRAQPLALRRRLLRRAYAAVRPHGRELGFAALEAARQVAEDGATGARVDLPGGVALRVGYGELVMGARSDTGDGWPRLPGDEALPLPVPGEVWLGGWRLTAEVMSGPDLPAIAANADRWKAYVAVDEALLLRPRRPGERIRPLGLGGTKKLQDVMTDRKLPAAARDRWPLVATAGYPVWLVGHVLDERARVMPESRRVVCLRCLCEEVETG